MGGFNDMESSARRLVPVSWEVARLALPGRDAVAPIEADDALCEACEERQLAPAPTLQDIRAA